jgi:hypothetical protein
MTAHLRDRSTTSYVECTSFGGGHAILVGDAAHALCPNLGMGCTSAVADAVVLGDTIEAAGGDVARLPSVWTRTRLPEMHYLVKLGRGSEYLSYPGKGMTLWQALPGVIPLWLAHSTAWTCWKRLPGAPTGRSARSCLLASRSRAMLGLVLSSNMYAQPWVALTSALSGSPLMFGLKNTGVCGTNANFYRSACMQVGSFPPSIQSA